MHDSNDSGYQLVAVIALLVGAVIVSYWRKFSLDRLVSGPSALPDSEAASAIISFYTAGHLLAPAGKGTIGGLKYASYVTVPDGSTTAFVDSLGVISVLDLPFSTETHLVGLSKQHKVDRLKFANFVMANGMEKVELEGDFPDYVELYAARGQQVNVREVLEPDAMRYVVDYCSSHFWEINNAEMYFVAGSDDTGNADIFEASRKFVDQIRPALLPGQPGAAVVHHQVSYGEYDGPALLCPVCGKQMATNGLWHVCPDGQGVLIGGRELTGLHDHRLHIAMESGKTAPHEALSCPNCHNPMTAVDYQESGVIIDSCTHCPYRWLDAEEVVRLSSTK